jgi:thymidylate kinase
MIVCVTGSDCVGKSTLVKLLSEVLGWETIHFDKPKNYEDGKQQYFDFANKMNQNPGKNIICDRLHEGEWVYAPLYRGYKGDYMQEFEKEVTKNQDYLLVHVKADLQTVLERARSRGEDFVKEEDFVHVLNAFEEYKKEQQLPYITIDTTNSKTGSDVRKILDAMEIAKDTWKEIREGKRKTTRVEVSA